MPRPSRLTVFAVVSALALAGPAAGAAGHATGKASPPATHHPGWVPDPKRSLGTHDPKSPITHVVIVMQENHSFDEYFGMLPREGQPAADGFTFDKQGRPVNANSVGTNGSQVVFHRDQLCPGDSAGQSWNNTHKEIDHGKMDGFAALSRNSMSYYNRADIPFYYSLARSFTLANRWFSSAPAQTYPNRRFLYAGTAYGNISTDTNSYFDAPPPNGTIMDEYAKYGVSWHDYVTDLPDTALIPSNLERYPQDYTDINQFYVDAKLGTLPDVSYIESDGGVPGEVAGPVQSGLDSTGAPQPKQLRDALYRFAAAGGDEEGDDVRIGQKFVSRIVNAAMSGPEWQHTLLIWNYDEHGGYYDHVAPPTAIAPDNIPPKLAAGDYPGGYDQLGVRVPAVVVSAYSRPHAVTDVVHDHTSILAEIERLWNLPALTYRDANAHDLSDFLNLKKPALLKPPTLAAPGPIDLRSCTADS